MVVLELKNGTLSSSKQQTLFVLKKEMGRWGMSFTNLTSVG
jgi:hypothetical protein